MSDCKNIAWYCFIKGDLVIEEECQNCEDFEEENNIPQCGEVIKIEK